MSIEAAVTITVAFITVGGGIIVAVIELIKEARKGRQLLGERTSDDDPTILQTMLAIHSRLGHQEMQNIIQDNRLGVIENDVGGILTSVEHIEGRVHTLEDLAREREVINKAGRKGTIERREQT